MEFSVEEAIKYAKKGILEEWVHSFLTTVGKNEKLSEIMRDKGFLESPKKISLDKLTRICGPEAEMKFHEPKDKWDKKVSKMAQSIKENWDPPPLIAWDFNGELSIADGSHRVEALKKSSFKSYWVIIWHKNNFDGR